MSATYEGMSPGGHETYATSIFSKIKTYLDSNPYGYVSKTGDTMTGNLTAPKFIGALQGNATTATTANKARLLGDETIRPASANTTTYNGALRYFLSTTAMTTGKPIADGSILSMEWDNSGGYAKQLYLGHRGGVKTIMQVRSQNAGTWGSWIPVGVFRQTTPISGQVVITDGTDGGIKSSGYTIATSVPSDAVFTDTKNTAGSTDTSSKLFLIGATSQAANPQTYSQDTAYVGTDGCLYSGGTKVLTAHQDISGKADKSATVSTVTWSSNKLTKTINGTTSDVVSAATILSNLTSSQVTTALGYTPASVNTTYDFESSDDSISFNGSAVGSVVTVDMTVNGKVSTEGDTISGDYVNTANFSEGSVYGKRVTTYGPWGIDVEEYLADSLWSRLSLRDSDILLTKTWDGTNTSLKSSISSLNSALSDLQFKAVTGHSTGTAELSLPSSWDELILQVYVQQSILTAIVLNPMVPNSYTNIGLGAYGTSWAIGQIKKDKVKILTVNWGGTDLTTRASLYAFYKKY